MKAYIICVKGNQISEKGTEVCISSSKKVKNDFKINVFDAVTAEKAQMVLRGNGLRWK